MLCYVIAISFELKHFFPNGRGETTRLRKVLKLNRFGTFRNLPDS